MGMHQETLKEWVRRATGNGDQRRPLADDERDRLKQFVTCREIALANTRIFASGQRTLTSVLETIVSVTARLARRSRGEMCST
jgi:hypothetical protein